MKASNDKYKLAQDAIADGDWHVDPAAGLLFGVKGHPMGGRTVQGYLKAKIGVRYSRIRKGVYVHRVIWEYVNGPLLDHLHVNHINGVKDDNRIVNLEAVTARENVIHAYEAGLSHTFGENHPRATLTEESVKEIYRRAWDGAGHEEIAKQCEISAGNVTNIKNGVTWSRTTGHDPSNPPKRPAALCAVLSVAEVKEIYRLAWETNTPYATIASAFGISKPTISEIKLGRTWHWATGHEQQSRQRDRKRRPDAA